MAGFDVDTDQLRSHANTLDQLLSSMNEAVTAGRTSSSPNGAFGLMFCFLEPVAMGLQSSCTDTIEALSGTLEGAASAIRTMAEGYDHGNDYIVVTVNDAFSEIC